MSKITTINPATEEEIQTYDLMSEHEATERVEACHDAFLKWREVPRKDRATYLTKIAQKLSADRGNILYPAMELPALSTCQGFGGKPDDRERMRVKAR